MHLFGGGSGRKERGLGLSSCNGRIHKETLNLNRRERRGWGGVGSSLRKDLLTACKYLR